MSTDIFRKYELPKGWVWKKLGEVCAVTDRDHRTPKYIKEGIPLISPRDFKKNGIDFSNMKIVEVSELTAFKKKCNPEVGDILYSRIGTIGEARLVDFIFDFVALHSIALIKPLNNKIDSKYLLYLMQSSIVKSQAIHNIKSVGTPDLGLKRIKEFDVPVAPFIVQHQIVAEIEKQFSRLDEAVASLKRIQANLKRYKAAVLKAAVEGILTEQWRKDHPDVEPADQLLKRILAERRAKWEDVELAKMKDKGIKPKDDSWKKKYTDPAGPDTTNLPELPDGWVWTSMDVIIVWGPQNGIYLHKSLYKPGISILRIDDYQDGFSRSKDDLRQVEASDKDKVTYRLEEGDLVINRVNSLTHLGKCLVVKERNIPSLFESNMMRLRVASSIEVMYVEMYLRSKSGRTFLTGNAKWAVNQASINQDDVKSTPVSLPPLHEQRFILEEIDRRLSVTEELETTTETNLKRAERLRQTILQRAFSDQQ